MFSLSERSAGMRSPRFSKSLLILWTYPKTVLDLGLQSMIKFSTKQATTRSYPGSSPQGSGINFCLHHFKYWACLNRSVSIAEPCLSLASFASIKCPKSLRAVLDSVGRNDNVSIPHDPVEVCEVILKRERIVSRFLYPRDIICDLVFSGTDPCCIYSNVWANQESTKESCQGSSNNWLFASMRSPILGADVVCYTKNHWMRIIDDVTLRDDNNCRAVVY